MSSFGEKKAMKFAKEESVAMLQYNRRQLSRIYPNGSRIDSSNYDPVPLWNVGCQLGRPTALHHLAAVTCRHSRSANSVDLHHLAAVTCRNSRSARAERAAR